MNNLRIHLIWVYIDGNPFLTGAWDDADVTDNRDGFNAMLAVQRSQHGEDYVRVQIANIPFDAVESLFKTSEITITQ